LKVAVSKDDPEWKSHLQELQVALKEHNQRMRTMAAEIPIRPERRSKE
jgi:hypothetical protein